MLKTTGSSDVLGPEREHGNSKVVGFGVGGGGEELAKKLGKSKSQNLVKSQKLSKLGKSKIEKSKKPSKSGNSPNFDATETGLSFLTPKAKTAFNRLWLAFTKAPIL